VTSSVCLRAFVDAAGLPFAMPADRQEYLPQLWCPAASGTKADVAASSADCPLGEMIFEHLAPSCYLCGPSSILLEQSASSSGALDELPAGDMHRAVLNISEVYAEICETAERIVACSPREWGHGKRAYGKRAYGMSAGG
jgi:hypothetical protein